MGYRLFTNTARHYVVLLILVLSAYEYYWMTQHLLPPHLEPPLNLVLLAVYSARLTRPPATAAALAVCCCPRCCWVLVVERVDVRRCCRCCCCWRWLCSLCRASARAAITRRASSSVPVGAGSCIVAPALAVSAPPSYSRSIRRKIGTASLLREPRGVSRTRCCSSARSTQSSKGTPRYVSNAFSARIGSCSSSKSTSPAWCPPVPGVVSGCLARIAFSSSCRSSHPPSGM